MARGDKGSLRLNRSVVDDGECQRVFTRLRSFSHVKSNRTQRRSLLRSHRSIASVGVRERSVKEKGRELAKSSRASPRVPGSQRNVQPLFVKIRQVRKPALSAPCRPFQATAVMLRHTRLLITQTMTSAVLQWSSPLGGRSMTCIPYSEGLRVCIDVGSYKGYAPCFAVSDVAVHAPRRQVRTRGSILMRPEASCGRNIDP